MLLVNARHVKNVSGRKSDVLDCQWLQQLMSYGLLRGAFRPTEAVCVLRSLTRQRDALLRAHSRHVQHMHKALTQMNIQLANLISDVAGATGQRILRAIVAGERDGLTLAALKGSRIHASTDDIAKSLQGNWRDEHLFALKQALAAFARAHVPDVRDGSHPHDVTTALVVLSEIGTDMSRFATVKHFTSWLGLCPGTKITGGKLLSGKTKRCANRAAQALRLAAAALRSSKSALGAYPPASE